MEPKLGALQTCPVCGISMAEMMRRIFDTYFELENTGDKND